MMACSSIPRTPVASIAPLLAATLTLVAVASGCSSGLDVRTPPAPVRVSVSPPTTTVGYGGTARFSATVSGAEDQAVSWSMQESSGCGSIEPSGVYTAPGSDATCHVVAESNVDRTKTAVATVTVSSTGHLFLGGYFPIGVFMQNHDTFQTWRDRGVNLLVGEPNWTMEGMTHDEFIQFWDQQAAALGMRTIRRPLSSPAADVGNTTLLAWSQEDEPDAVGGGLYNLSTAIAQYDLWKSIDPSRPVYLNFSGPDVLIAVGGPTDPPPDYCTPANGGCSTVANHLDYVNRTLDWSSNDIYPFTGWLPDEGRRGDAAYVADPIDRLSSWTDKPQFCFIETSNQFFVETGTGVTPGAFRAEIWIAIIHGVRGYVFFPQVVAAVGGTPDSDGTPPGVVAEMIAQNRIVTELAPTLQGPVNPATVSADVPPPLQAGWRDAPGAAYFIVVNPQNATVSSAQIGLTGVGGATSATVYGESRSVSLSSGSFTDTFGPYAVHIYVVPK